MVGQTEVIELTVLDQRQDCGCGCGGSGCGSRRTPAPELVATEKAQTTGDCGCAATGCNCGCDG